MKQRIALIAIVAALCFSAALAGRTSVQASAQTPTMDKLRFVHALPGGAAVDVFVDNLLAARNLQYADATRYLNVKPGAHTVVVTATGTQPSATSLLNTKITLTSDKPALLIVIEGTTDKPEAAVVDEDLGPIAPGNTRLTAVHAIKDGSAVDLVRASDGSPLIQNLMYGQVYGAFDIPAGAPDLAFVPAGGKIADALLSAPALPLVAGTHNTLIALGTTQGSVKPSYLLLTAPTDSNAPTDVLVRFVNAAASSKSVDVYVNGKLTVPALAFGMATLHLPIAAGATTIELRNTGDAPSAAAIGNASLTLAGATAKAETAWITSAASGLTIQNTPDNISTLDPTKARVNLINAVGKGATASFNGTAWPDTTKTLELASGSYKLAPGDAGTITLNGGTLTDLVLAGDPANPQVITGTTGLSEQPGSIAGTTVALAQAGTSPSPAGTTAIQAGTAPATAAVAPVAGGAATRTPVAIAPTPTLVPTQAVAPTDVPPTAVPGVIGTVNTNPGVNLKIRQYPRQSALTLALAPSQATLLISGIRGAPSSTGTPLPTGSPANTPTISVTSRADVWLFVSWQTPDGGTVTGWTLAEYLDITVNGKHVAGDDTVILLTFKRVPENTAGEVQNSSITPVTGSSNQLVGTVVTNAGTNAQLRRTPDLTGESLALVPAAATVTVLSQTNIPVTPVVGAPKSPTWYFVQYSTSDGSSVFGWMSSDFVTVTRHNKAVDPTEIPVATEITRGYTQGNVATVAPPITPGLIATVINVNQGANLQLRRDPNVNAQSLGLIPTGAQLSVLGRNGSGAWIQVTYQGQTGWVDSLYVTIAKNGKPVKMPDIVITNGEINTFGTTTPTLTPTGAG